MRSSGPWTGGRPLPPNGGTVTVTRARYSVRDVVTLMGRELPLMFIVFAALFAIGAAAAWFLIDKTYTARASLIVGLGQEYVYQPRAGDADRVEAPKIEEIVLSEIEILNSEALRRRVIAKLGMGVIEPELAARWRAATGARKAEIEAAVLKEMSSSFGVHAPPATGAIRLTYKHKQPQSASRILNTLISEYMVYRKEVFRDASSPEIARQRQEFEDRLAIANEEYETFLATNGIGDFPGDKAALTTLYGQMLTERFLVEARLREAQGRLAGLQPGLSATPSEISLNRDIDMRAPNKLAALRVERNDLLSRYRPDSQPVRDIDAKIRELEGLIAAGSTMGDRDRKMGPNPVWQDVEKSRIQTESEISSLVSRREELQRQLNSIVQRQQALTALEADYQNLAVEREVLAANVKAFATRQEDARAAGEMAAATEDNIRVVERAETPGRGESLRRVAFVAAFLLAAFTALCVGLLRVFTRPGFASAQVAERTLDLPVLATATMKSR